MELAERMLLWFEHLIDQIANLVYKISLLDFNNLMSIEYFYPVSRNDMEPSLSAKKTSFPNSIVKLEKKQISIESQHNTQNILIYMKFLQQYQQIV